MFKHNEKIDDLFKKNTKIKDKDNLTIINKYLIHKNIRTKQINFSNDYANISDLNIYDNTNDLTDINMYVIKYYMYPTNIYNYYV